MNEAWLAHHGIKDMKWGVRRFQDKNGKLTEAGRKRYRRDVEANSHKKFGDRVRDEDLEQVFKDPKRWVKEDRERTKKVVDSSREMTRSLQELNKATNKTKEKPRLDLSKMTDKDLRDAIQREQLERQYNSLFNAPETSRGREYVQDTLSTAGAALGVVSSALAIALAIRELKG